MTEPLLDDQTFITQFEHCTLNPEHFNHTGHVRLAWLYLQQNSEKTAIGKVCNGIKSYASSLGANDKFHVTITYSLLKLIALRVNQSKSKSWQEFNAQNSDLLEDCIGLLLQHYNKETLFSELARTQFVAPDIQAIN